MYIHLIIQLSSIHLCIHNIVILLCVVRTYIMDKYQKIDEVGRGLYGVVYKALNLHDGETVAIKKLYTRKYSVKDCKNIREINSLINLNNHANIVKLQEIINKQGIVFLVFEYMECSLYDRIINQTKPFSESEFRNMCFQILQGVAHIHRQGYVHRDLKPSNILVSKNAIKIGDFGFTRECSSHPPFTHNVTTPAYRALEVFLESLVYDIAVDIWAVGVIMAELFTLKPLFQGCSGADVMYKMCKVLGTPTETTWPGEIDLARKMKYQFPDGLFGYQFSTLLPNASADAVNLIASLLSWDPSMRPTAIDALQHPFFDRCYHIPRSVCHEPPIVTLSLIKVPILFRMAMERELLKKEACLRSCIVDEEKGSKEELVHMLPEYLFDYEMEKESKCRFTELAPTVVMERTHGLQSSAESTLNLITVLYKWLMYQCLCANEEISENLNLICKLCFFYTSII
ncbi:putative protein-serine/threonine kinase CMGC-RCK family [Helianthus annuus]|uniref:Protein kinase domain-containing protein n=2 Tax=Helianthus annuus TaxID=4232 RepID=A0A9K3JVH3_HELAN|nr:putative protein-serine/threonine kinase CMGC-RCK family [Helianthus annuus]KAJ0611099.1 putative protein-serine/threonine kinase CMGC-RCK family [Helianthus annuus]KAJ0622036.1 putative protein-serine/threonine kinase CMGC-RCK family [Helianthus annuus]KAJ0626366.1 putative protein-serine/threonine kinase CMGC-RCK family [Helianthus annuus]KAJ0782708.1 putative protein-serine/threonine kinase CMGC-RCK family [Helianthus annuus]